MDTIKDKLSQVNMEKLKQFASFAMAEAGEVTSFVNYDLGLAKSRTEVGNDYEKLAAVCNNFETNILNQGMFQQHGLNSDVYASMKKWCDEHKNDVAKVNFFLISTSLVDAANIVMDILPVVNIYHSAIGITFEDDRGTIIRSAILQLEFGAYSGVTDLVNRFLTPQFCMSAIFEDKLQPDGSYKNVQVSPKDMSEDQIGDNLFIDYSYSVSGLMFNFLETEDYMTSELVESMGCVNPSNLATQIPIPFAGFINQNIPMSKFYHAYEQQQKQLSKFQGPADGTIFTLAGFGPSPLTPQAGLILNFATTSDFKFFEKLLDWSYTNYASCSVGLNNNLQFYATIGVDKVTPLSTLDESCIEEELKKPNIISTDDGFIRESLGRTTHCNTVAAVVVTLLENVFVPEEPSCWSYYTDFQNKELQSMYFYMLNPCIPSFPVVDFSENWEYGVSIKELNMNPIYKSDKVQFYRMLFFVKLLAMNMVQNAEKSMLSDAAGGNMFATLLSLFDNPLVKKLCTTVFGNKAEGRYEYTRMAFIAMFCIYVVVRFQIYDHFYWATGQSTRATDGSYQLPVTDPMPTIFKIDLTQNNVAVLLSFIESYVGMKSLPASAESASAGDQYMMWKDGKSPTVSLIGGIQGLNRWVHPYPTNKFFLWFPGVMVDNKCMYIPLNTPIISYIPDIEYYRGTLTEPTPKKKCSSTVEPHVIHSGAIVTTSIVVILIFLLWRMIFFTKSSGRIAIK